MRESSLKGVTLRDGERCYPRSSTATETVRFISCGQSLSMSYSGATERYRSPSHGSASRPR